MKPILNNRYDTEVKSLDDAIKLADKWKSQGKFNWFRGQHETWSLKSSLVRYRIENKNTDIKERLDRFFNWFLNQSSLEKFAHNGDSLWAIAQHYGIPTNFIDFTTNPTIAAFFAKSPKKKRNNLWGCVLCLNTHNLKGVQNFTKKALPNHPFLEVESLSLEVDYLWRMQAQQGKFLYVPYEGFDKLYPLNRIIFPQIDNNLSISKSSIYPNRKSYLETKLDEYFKEEQMIYNSKRLKKFALECNFEITHLENSKNFDPSLFHNAKLPLHTSWNEIKLSSWNNPSYSSYKGTKFITINLDISNIESDNFRNKLKVLLSKYSKSKTLIKWRCSLPQKKISFSRSLNASVNRLWDGLQMHPFSLGEKELAIIHTIRLALKIPASGRQIGKEHSIRKLLNNKISTVLVDVGKEHGISNKVVIDTENFNNAIRSDLINYLKVDYHSYLKYNPVFKMLFVVRNPKFLFDFSLFKIAFISEILPYQILTCNSSEPIFFNPTEIDIMGIA